MINLCQSRTNFAANLQDMIVQAEVIGAPPSLLGGILQGQN